MRFRMLVTAITAAVVVIGAAGVAVAASWFPPPPGGLNTLNVYEMHVEGDDNNNLFAVAVFSWHNCDAGDPSYAHDITVRITSGGVPSSTVHTVPQGQPGDHVDSVRWPAGNGPYTTFKVTASADWPNSRQSTMATYSNNFNLRLLDG